MNFAGQSVALRRPVHWLGSWFSRKAATTDAISNTVPYIVVQGAVFVFSAYGTRWFIGVSGEVIAVIQGEVWEWDEVEAKEILTSPVQRQFI